MRSARQIAANRKNAEQATGAARQQRMFNLMRKKEPLIPLSVLKALAGSGLPPRKTAYNKRLKELLGT